MLSLSLQLLLVRYQNSSNSSLVVQCLTCVQLFVTPWTAAVRLLCLTISLSLLKLMFIWISDAIQPSHPLPPASPLALSLSQHQGLFQWVSLLYQMARVLELQLLCQSFQWIFRIDLQIDWFDHTNSSLIFIYFSLVFSSVFCCFGLLYFIFIFNCKYTECEISHLKHF